MSTIVGNVIGMHVKIGAWEVNCPFGEVWPCRRGGGFDPSHSVCSTMVCPEQRGYTSSPI
jgi:hypothetical protein